MNEFVPDPDFLVENEETIRGLVGETHELAIRKVRDRLGTHARDFIGRSPFICIGSQSPGGGADVSPRGDPPGFVRVLDDRTLAIPDRPGNNRVDTLVNVVRNPRVGILFVVPGFDETLRVNGRAVLTNEPGLLRGMAVNDRDPKLAIVVRIDEIFMHCAKAFRRSRLWDPDRFQDRGGMPSLVKIVSDETTDLVPGPEEQRELDRQLEDAYRNTLY